MLDDLAATVENLWPRFEALGHTIENVLVFEAGNRAERPSFVRRVRSGHTSAFWPQPQATHAFAATLQVPHKYLDFVSAPKPDSLQDPA